MPAYKPPIEDIAFLLGEVFDFDHHMQQLPGFQEVTADLAVSVLDEAGKFCTGVLEPLNRSGDEQGCQLADGLVTTPDGLREAYRTFADAGWTSLSGDPEYGGQGLPRSIQILLDETLSSANLSFGLFAGLTRGAVDAIAHHASDALKAAYLPRMISGEWTGAMALTEAGAGTDLGLLSTRALPAGDGSYRISGTKIFISSGDHDFGGNIIHLVLARLSDAPQGVRGLSLFLVPKYILDAEGDCGGRNTMSVGGLEKKMGIHAQPTCTMIYDEAVGWLVGEAGRGLSAMFTMMNAERLFVGIQGLGIAEVANQKAVAYARERRQGRSADGMRSPVPIIEHGDVSRMLFTGRAFADAARALAIWTALQMDIADRHPDAQARQRADGLVSLLTPVIKAAYTDFGFETAVLSQQVFGGHGYIREWGMEQHVRDARITQIYEGTNGVQAMDLVGRKLAPGRGDAVVHFFELIRQDLQIAIESDAGGDIAVTVLQALERLEHTTQAVQSNNGSPGLLGALATDYLRLFALVSFGWMWVRMSHRARSTPPQLSRRKAEIARFFVTRILPQTISLETTIVDVCQAERCPASDVL